MLFRRLFQDPPVLLAFEVGSRFVTGALRDSKTSEVVKRAHRVVDVGVVEPSFSKSNVQDSSVLAEAVSQILEEIGSIGSPDTALILPDGSSRLTVFDFDHFPNDTKERLQLIRFRLKKTVPFDVQSACIAYQIWRLKDRVSVLVAATPVEIIEQYEHILRSVGLKPGYVSLSAMSAMNLVPMSEMSLLIKLAERVLTMVAFDSQAVRMVRNIEITSGAAQQLINDDPNTVLDEVIADVYPTFIFIADNLQHPVRKLFLGGFDGLIGDALIRFSKEFRCEVEPLEFASEVLAAHDVGVRGFFSQH